jgi:phosphodiesterase/alkaline phosphatase D-like protein
MPRMGTSRCAPLLLGTLLLAGSFAWPSTKSAQGAIGADRAAVLISQPATSPTPPTVVTTPASAITQTTASLNGTVNPNGAEVSKCEFEYGTSVSYGKTASCSTLPGSGESPVAVSAAITGLSANSTYHYRIVATNSSGSSPPGLDETFKTPPSRPTVVTTPASSISQTTATLNGSVNPNGAEVSKCEFEYGPTTEYGETVDCATLPGSGETPVPVSAAVTVLSVGTTYHYRIVAVGSGGTSRGVDGTFKTLPAQPAVVAAPASSITQTTATLNGSVNPNGSEVSKCEFDYGTTVAYGKTATCVPSPGTGEAAVAVSAPLSGLTANTTYHYRIVATNSGGSSQTQDGTFKTLPAQPAVVAAPASSITQTTATLNGSVNPNGGEVSKCEFEYGPTTEYGETVDCATLPGSGESPVTVSAAITGLTANITYHYRIVATNSGGSGQTQDGTFKTLPAQPAVVAAPASSITQTTATLNGSVNPNGAEMSKCEFEYGTTVSYGKTATCVPSPGTGEAAVAVSASLSGLSVNTTYHYRIVAVSPGGTSLGVDETFKTPPAPPAVVSEPASVVAKAPAILGVLFFHVQKPPVQSLKLVSTSSTASASGAIGVTVSCPSGQSDCQGTITIRTLDAVAVGGRGKSKILTLTHGSFDLPGGRKGTVKLRLSARAQTLLARAGVLRARATIVTHDPTGTTQSQTIVKLR